MEDGGDWLKVCVSCDHDPETARRPLLGEVLAAEVEAGLRRRGLGAAVELRRVHCLASCQLPSTVIFGAMGKRKLRFHGLGGSDTEAILDLAEAYVLGTERAFDASKWAERLRKCLVVSPGTKS